MLFSTFRWKNNLNLHLSAPVRAYIQYRHKRFDLMTGFAQGIGVDSFFQELKAHQVDSKPKQPLVIHLMYELGFLLGQSSYLLSDDDPLAIVIEYQKTKFIKPKTKLKKIPLKGLERPNWTEYKEAFHYLQEELLKGNGYQFNLTYPFDFYTDDFFSPTDIHDFFFSKKLSSFAHASFLGEEMILSNSPECLFTLQGDYLYSMPIKGTVKKKKNAIKKQVKDLFNDPKEDSELIMISDLIRNDLNRLSNGDCEVPKIKKPLVLNNLIHQYSLLKTPVQKHWSLFDIISTLFPGGSITGAPKINAIRTLGRVERYKRSVYCGTTILSWKSHLTGSINIRTAKINVEERLWTYGAGGGITLKSQAHSEFSEMESKVESFLTLLS
ncbi:MAG TPA: chorismate-binding protein [Bacteriovoracaceae bacterium]|nr:chorismate-binding protein [Bacteriovoracaceae bacterium]